MLYNNGDAGQSVQVTLECGADNGLATLINENPPGHFKILLKAFGACRSVCACVSAFKLSQHPVGQLRQTVRCEDAYMKISTIE